MRLGVWLGLGVAVLGGCNFNSSGLDSTGADGNVADDVDAAAGRVDARPSLPDAAQPPPIPDAAVPLPDAPPPPPPFCELDPELVACFEFEGTASDGSMYGNAMMATGAAYAAGFDGMALDVAPGAMVTINETTVLDVDGLTMEMWVYPQTLPTMGARHGLLDNNGQYGLFVHPGGQLVCAVSNASVVVSGVLPAGAWTHVACTYDNVVIRLYVDGAQVGMTNTTVGMITTGTNGTAIGRNSPSGDPFDGLIDDLRVWGRARTASEICDDAGCLP